MTRGRPDEAERGEGGHARWRRCSTGQWLALLVAAFFLGPLCVSNLWGYFQSRVYLTEAAFRNLRNVAALEASETLGFVRAAESLVRSIVAGNQHLFGLLRALARSEDAERRGMLSEELSAHLRAKAHEDPSVKEFQVLTAAGVEVASSRPGFLPGRDVSGSTCFREGRRGHGVAGFEYGSGASHHHRAGESEGSHDHAPDILLAAPIAGGNGTSLGIFCARFGFDVHRNLLVAHRDRTRHATLYLLGSDGRIVCGSFDEPQDAPYGDRLAPLDRSRVRFGKAWEGRYRSEAGEEMLLAYAPISSLDWGVAVEVPVSRALADLERLKWKALGASFVLAMVLMLAAYLVWRMLVRPLKDLAHTSERIAAGASGETVWLRGPREVANLAAAFNRMSLALRSSHDLLESKIEERTRELRESQEFSELLLDSIDQRVIVVDPDHRIIKANAAANRMHERKLVGTCAHEIFEGLSEPPDDYPARRIFETGRPASGERSQETAAGQQVVHVEAYPIFDADGRVASVVEVARVITAEKRSQMQMVYQEKMAAFGQLAAGIAHDIGNPLAAIESQLRLAQDDPTRASQTLDVVRKQIGRMHGMLREVVDFTRRRRDTARLASANQAVEDVIRLLEHDPRARTVSISSRLAENLPGIRTKEDYLVQTLLNLGLNALDAMPDGGKLVFETRLEEDGVAVRVWDTGAGIPEHLQSRIFEPFFTTKEMGHGTGLGLFVSKSIVEALGGDLELERSGPSGTIFAVHLAVEGPEVDGAQT